MSIVSSPPQPATWAKVEEGFFVGSRAGAFLGYIDQEPSGYFVASNMYSRTIGEFQSLGEAMQAIDDDLTVETMQREEA